MRTQHFQAGILNIHKPPNVSSRFVVDRVEECAGKTKVGHAGTLDPLATGVLVVCVGPATRLISLIQEGKKAYQAEFRLGQTSDTDDITGQIVDSAVGYHPLREDIERLLPSFLGQIEQVPPQFSAVHVAGQRAYAKARQGKTVDIPARTVHIHRLEILDYTYPTLKLEMECGSGTYVRSLARDLGQLLGCGGLMVSLVRTQVGQFHLREAIDFESITPQSVMGLLQSPLTAVAHLPRVECDADERRVLSFGRPIRTRESFRTAAADEFALVDTKGELFALARHDETGALIAPHQVFIPQVKDNV